MLSWLFRLLLAILLVRWLVRRVGALRRPTDPRIDPASRPSRENPRGRPAFDPHDVEDAEYEDLPGQSR